MGDDNRVVLVGEDIGKAGGVFKATVGLYEKILGAAMGAAMTGLRPIAEIMFSDFLAVCFDYVANEMSKLRYMTNGQLSCLVVIRTGNGRGVRFGAQHFQSIENWTMMIPGVKVVAPSSPADVIGLMAAAVRDPDTVIFHEHKAEVIDVRSLVPLDTKAILGSVAKTGRLFTVEENPRLCGWGAEIASIVADEAFWDLRGPIVRITTPHIPLPAADHLEDLALPSAARIAEKVRRRMNG
jgi:acetoin:2,6-dichlorophenolindophenol oxidoreductase subunit beta